MREGHGSVRGNLLRRFDDRWTGADERSHLLERGPSFFAAYRGVARVRQLLVDRPASAGRRLAAGAGLIGDLALLRGSDRSSSTGPPSLRVAVGVGEQALWAAMPADSLDSTVLLGMPLATQAGLRLGGAGLVVPAANALAAAAAMAATGRRRPLTPYVFQVVAVLAGWGLGRFDDRHHARLDRQEQAGVAADERRAFLAGQHAVAMGADNIVDRLAKAPVPLLLVDPSAGEVRSPVAAWKAELARTARSEATYLTDAVRTWERAHNTASPVLAHDIEVRVRDGDLVLLRPRQVDALVERLDGLGLVGRFEIRPDLGRGHLIGASLVLEVGVRGETIRIVLPEEPDAPEVGALVPAPFGPLLMAVWCAFQVHPRGEHIPAAAAAPGVLLSLATAGWAWQATEDDRTMAATVLACSATALVHSVVATPRIGSQQTAEGLQPHPFIAATWAPLTFLALDGPSLPPAVRWSSLALLAGAGAAGLVLHPDPIRWGDLAAALQLSVVGTVVARGWRRTLDAHAAEVAATYAAERERRKAVAFRAGGAEVLALVRSGLDDVEAALDRQGSALDPEIRAAVAQRIADVRERLAALAQELVSDPGGAVAAEGPV